MTYQKASPRGAVFSSSGARLDLHLGFMQGLVQENQFWGYDFVYGSSGGSLMAAYLAQYKPDKQKDAIDQLPGILKEMGVYESSVIDSYPFGPLQGLMQYGSIYSNERIRMMTYKLLDVKRLRSSGVHLRVVATQYGTAEPRVYTAADDDILEAVIASTSIQFMFPSVQIRNEFLGDGGLYEYTPVRVAMAEGRVTHLDVFSTCEPDALRTFGGKSVQCRPRIYDTINTFLEHLHRNSNMDVQMALERAHVRAGLLKLFPNGPPSELTPQQQQAFQSVMEGQPFDSILERQVQFVGCKIVGRKVLKETRFFSSAHRVQSANGRSLNHGLSQTMTEVGKLSIKDYFHPIKEVHDHDL